MSRKNFPMSSRTELKSTIANAFLDCACTIYKALHEHVFQQSEDLLPSSGKWCFDIKGACEYLDISETSLKRLRDRDIDDPCYLPSFTTAADSKPRFHKDDLDRILKTRA